MQGLELVQPLSAGATRRTLCELADLYAAEQTSKRRPITELLPHVLPPLCGVSGVDALDLFDRFSRQRAICRDGAATYPEIDAAEILAERLLDQLVGETS